MSKVERFKKLQEEEVDNNQREDNSIASIINRKMVEEQQQQQISRRRRRRKQLLVSSNDIGRPMLTTTSCQCATATMETPPINRFNIGATTICVGILLTLLSPIVLAAASAANQIVVLEPIGGGGSNSTTTSRYTTSGSTLISGATAILQASFSTPNQAINITHVTYDPLYDTVYVGATNAIYQLSGTDLSEQHEQTTGPVFDNPSCGITECHGYEDYMKPTQNVNKILVIDYQHKKLLSCGSTKQGACRRYQLNNIAQKEDLISMAVAANDDNSSTYAFIAPARYTYDPSTVSSSTSSLSSNSSGNSQQQQVLYVATTYTKVGQSRDLLVPAIGTRILDEGPNLLKLYENSFLDSARIDINSHLRDYFLVNYLYGFASSNYIYFVTLQKKATSRDYEELGYHTRLARICITDSSYNSYTEVDLKCMPNKRRSTSASTSKHPSFFGQQQQQQQQASVVEYPLLQDAILVDAGSQLLQSLGQNDQSSPLSADFFFNNPSSGSGSPDDNKVLLGVFSSARDHTQHAGEHSALCAFSLSQIEDKFNDNIHNCYTGKMQSRNMEYIAGNVQECPKSGQGGNVVNFCHETLKINGTLPIVSEASIQFYNTTLTAITATSHINSNTKNIYSDQLASESFSSSSSSASKSTASVPSTSSSGSINLAQSAAAASSQHTVVFMGTSNGHIKKVLLNNASNGIEFEDVQLDTNPILSDLHLHSSGQQLIAATPYKVMKVPTHNCSQYSTCRECSQSKNPYCGWCSLKRSCTTKNECVSSGSIVNEVVPLPARNSNLPGDSISGATAAAVGAAASKQLKWISNDSSGKCIDLQSIVPDKIPITSTGKVDLYIDRLPRLPKEHSYKCIFDRKEQTTATPMSFGLSCPLPKVMHRPKIQPGRDHAIVDLAVRSSETNTDFLNGKVTFFECQLHTTCKDCLTTNWGCNWCLNENICLFNTSKCEKTGQQAKQDSSLVQLVQVGGGRSTTASTSGGSTTNSPNQRSSSLSTLGNNGGNSFVSSLVQQQSSGQRTGNTIDLVNQCPTFDVGHKQDILIADGSEKELTIKVKNMPQFKGNIQCIVEIENDKIPLKARIEEDRVICENSTYSYAADVGLLNGQLVVIYSDNNIFIDRTNFTMYKCHLLGAYLNRPDCSLCQRIDPRFNCIWCAGACHHKSRCTERPDDTCPPPRIDSFHPLSGPTLGGTKVTIEGSNLGQSFEEIANRVTIGNVPCKPIEEEYRPSNKIVCITGPIVAAKYGIINRPRQQDNIFGASTSSQERFENILSDVIVGNKAGYTAATTTKFQYKSIHLRDHQPRYGPQSGGTRLTLTGVNLNIGSNIQVFLDELPCQVELSLLASEQLVCRTSASRHPSRAIKQLKLIIDDAQIIRDEDVFYYTQDPIISKISPLRSYLSGGRPINVYGSNLTAVQMPRMAILDATGKKINESTCILQDDSRMQCPSPAVNLPMMDLEWSEQHIGQYEAVQTSFSHSSPGSTWTPIVSTQQQPSTGQIKFASQQAGTGAFQQQQDESVKFRLSFIMDNVWRLRDLQTSYPSLNTEIAYTSDPKLYPFSSAQYKSAQEISMQQSNSNEQQTMANSQQLATYQQSYQVDSDTYLLQPGEPLLVLYGEHLRTAVSEYEITVTVGQGLCNLTQLTHTKLVCIMPLDHMATPTDEEAHPTQRALPLVVVRIGFSLRYELGYVQYHPLLVEQIVQTIANSSEHLPYMRPHYPQYMPRENETLLHKISSYITTTLLLLLYVTLGSILLAFVYSSLFLGYRLKRKSYFDGHEYRHIQSKIDSLEKSVKGECRIASMALQSDLNELVRHVDLSGIPLFNVKHYIMKVFFPGINNHPLLVNQCPPSSSSISMNMMQENHQIGSNNTMGGQVLQHAHHGNHTLTIQHPLKTSTSSSGTDFPMEYFERLILTKPFLVTFINTLEAQPSFTIRDKVNVASLIMIILMERLDYATDILRTLLFQLVERSVNRNDRPLDSIESKEFSSMTTKLTQRASNLLGGLTSTSKRGSRQVTGGLSKVVGGSASSLMASTTVAAQMLLSRVGNKTSPLQPHSDYLVNNGHTNTISGSNCMSTTAFNQRNTMVHTIGSQSHQAAAASRSLLANQQQAKLSSGQQHLMLRRTDSVVEKMLTNWLALNMYDYFHGEVGQSLYMMFEALKCQLDRGPIDSVSGDAYYSLNEHKLLREPHLQFEMVNLYIIVDTDILQPVKANSSSNNNNLLLDSSSALPYSINGGGQVGGSFYEDGNSMMIASRSASGYIAGVANTITLALRVLDCDTISQVKGKILSALYRNSPYSCRLGVDDVELSLRQQQQHHHHQQQVAGGQQYVTVTLFDEDYSSVTAFNGLKRINTLRHYGVTDQAIMMLKKLRPTNTNQRVCQSTTRTTLTDMLDEHYNNPYSEIQYGPIGRFDQQQQHQNQHQATHTQQLRNSSGSSSNNSKSWHLVRSDTAHIHTSSDGHSNDSSPSSHSPSMMLLGTENLIQTTQTSSHGSNMAASAGLKFNNNQAHHQVQQHQQQQQYYHPSSSSTSSTGNVMDTNSTSANSSSMMNVTTNLLMKTARTEQPIYCQIGSTRSQHGGANSSYYCQVGGANSNNHNSVDYPTTASQTNSETIHRRENALLGSDREHERQIYLTRMLTSKGTVQNYIDDFFKTILCARPPTTLPNMMAHDENNNFNGSVLCGDSDHTTTTRRGGAIASNSAGGACPPAVKWLFDLLDEAAMENGITDHNVIHAWKNNAFLLRFWANFIKNPNYILDVEKSNTLDATLSVVAQTLIDSCSVNEQRPNKESSCNKLLFARDVPKYKGLVKRFYQDIASMKPVSDQEIVKQMSSLSMTNAGRFDTNLALKELCVYAVNYGVELMGALNNDFTCQQLDLSRQLEQCFRSFTIFEAYR